jgi:hypothetical protein
MNLFFLFFSQVLASLEFYSWYFELPHVIEVFVDDLPAKERRHSRRTFAERPTNSPHEMMRLFIVLLPIFRAGTDRRPAFLGGDSALGPAVDRLPFSRVTFALSSHPTTTTLVAEQVVDGKPTPVAWHGVQGATARDMLLLTCENPEWGAQDAFDAIAATGAADGVIMLPPLPDLRCPFVVRYLRACADGTEHGEIVAEAKLVHESGAFGLRPKQAHLSFTSNREEMLLIWVSGHQNPPPSVQWGVSPGRYNGSSIARSTTYTAADLCNAPANSTLPWHFGLGPGYIHRAMMAPLPPSTTIYYRMGSDDHGWSIERSFRSRRAPPAADDDGAS